MKQVYLYASMPDGTIIDCIAVPVSGPWTPRQVKKHLKWLHGAAIRVTRIIREQTA